MKADLPSPETLRKLLRYEPETGKLFWRERGHEFFKTDQDWKKWNNRFANTEAFTSADHASYWKGAVLGKTYRAHRVIWAMQTNRWPPENIDHIDRIKANNSWNNLRSASKSQNCANVASRKNSTSQYLGVSWVRSKGKWVAKIAKNKEVMFLGYFKCEIEAASAYDMAATRLHQEFAHLNFPERKVA